MQKRRVLDHTPLVCFDGLFFHRVLIRFRFGRWFSRADLTFADVESRFQRLGRTVSHAVAAADALDIVRGLGRINPHLADAFAFAAMGAGALAELEAVERSLVKERVGSPKRAKILAKRAV